MTMSNLSIETFNFMAELWENNNKTWFDANRKRYTQNVQQPMKAMAESLTGAVSALLPEYNGRTKISRINNDIRFTPDKPPYKEHMWISFLTEFFPNCDYFVAIGHNGWAAGSGIGSNRKEDLDCWRKNLLTYQTIWRKYAKAADFGEKVNVYIDNLYKKPLFPDIPEDMVKLVQGKSIWLVQAPRLDFEKSPEEEFLHGLGIMLPYFLFMTVQTNLLPDRLSELGGKIPAPDKEIRELWKKLGG